MKTLHPNGFFVKLLFSIFGLRLRIHYWPTPTIDKSPHNHRSWFVSIPIFGEIIETLYEEKPGSVKVKMCGHNPGNGVPEVETGIGSAIEAASMRHHRALIPYISKTNSIHRVEVPRKTMTLVLFGPNKQRPKAWEEDNNAS